MIKTRNIALLSALMYFISCVNGYKDDWTFSSGVENTTLESPPAESITFTKNAEGTILTITWNVVYGALGYEFSFYDVSDPFNPVAIIENETVDGCSVKCAIAEDTNYKVTIRALGNPKYNNKDAVTATEAPFSTMVPAIVIPNGSDLYAYFTANPIPESAEEQAYELEAGGEYTLSGVVDFGKNQLTLRGNKARHPKLTYDVDGRLATTAGLIIKFIDFDMSAVSASSGTAALLLMSSTPDPAILGTGDYYIISVPVSIQSCNIKGLTRRLIFDNNLKYALTNLIINDCIIELNSTGEPIYLQGGFANDFTISNSTVYGVVTSSSYFLRYNNSGRPDRAGFATGSINFYNNTFYNVVYSGQMGNYSGMNSALVKLNVSQNIFVDCGSENVIRRLSAGGNNMTKTLVDNCYWYNGAFPQAGEVDHNNGDKSGTAYGEDPAFASPSTGDFTVGNSLIITKKGGDPRWLPQQ
jgi:hypothetical protein